jgi:hypothetical protein
MERSFMNATVLYRIAAVLFILFAAGHTLGFLRFKPTTPEGVAVRDGMNNVHFQVGGKSFSYGGFYTGFGLFITVDLPFSAFLAWHLGGLAARAPEAIGALGWAFCAVQVASLVLSGVYFFPVTAVVSGAVAVCLGWAAWLIR